MKRLLSIAGWWVGGLAALSLANVIFFAFVVVSDVVFGVAPQFAVPAFVPAVVVLGLVTSRFARSLVRARAGLFGRGAPALRTAVIIRRRQPAYNVQQPERSVYGATV